MKDSVASPAWRNLGLIHILVVSGGHLMILASCLEILPVFMPLRLVVLALFTLMNQLDPPVLRSLLGLLLTRRLRRFGWTNSESVLATTWICLPFLTGVRDLHSLMMSFTAALALSWTSRRTGGQPLLHGIMTQILIWWLMLPMLAASSSPHPLASLGNVVLAPLLGWTLVPLAFLSWLVGGPVLTFFKIFWEWLNRILEQTDQFAPDAITFDKASRSIVGLAFTIGFSMCCYVLISDRTARRRTNRGIWRFAIASTAAILIAVGSTLDHSRATRPAPGDRRQQRTLFAIPKADRQNLKALSPVSFERQTQ